MPVPSPTLDSARSFYKAGLLGLRALDAHEGRGLRFGPDADARWSRFCGALHDGDRVDMLMRDAAVTWGPAFAAARVFKLTGVASDEPFGADWVTPNAGRGRDLLASAPDAPPTLAACATALGIQAHPVDVPSLRPGRPVVVAGGAAILALAAEFATRTDLDWALQVTVIADAPAHRQLSGLASVFTHAVRPCRLLTSETADVPENAIVVVSSDATLAAATAARS
jgi:hypothetical protein